MIARDPVLFRLPGLPIVQQQLYAAADFCTVDDLPWADATPERPFGSATGFGRVLDLRDFAFDPAFRGQPMIDFFLRRLGVEPAAIAPARRRNAWLAARLAPLPPLGDAVLLCPRSSMQLRDMPQAICEAVEGFFRVRAPVIVQRPVADLGALAAQVRGARLVVSTDTAMVHLADALSVPCIAFFTTHRPEWRMRDYPLCRAVHLPVDLPPALEFSRGPADLAAARAAWFPHGDDFQWLDAALSAALESLPGAAPSDRS